MRLLRFPYFPHFLAVPTAGEQHRLGLSGDVSASLFGPPLPVDRPG